RKRSPPCTIRWPTASIAPAAPTHSRNAVSSTSARGAAMSASARSASPGPSSRSFRLLEPALTTRTRKPPRSGGERPVAHVGHVVADLARVLTVTEALVDHVLAQLRRARAEPGD